MGQRPTFESVGDPFPLHILLADTSDNLRDINKTPLTPRGNHRLDRIRLVQTFLRRFSGVVSSGIQHLIHKLLKTLNHGPSRLGLHGPLLTLQYQFPNLLLRPINRVFDLTHGRRIGESIRNPNREGGLQRPVVDDHLYLRHEACRVFVAAI